MEQHETMNCYVPNRWKIVDEHVEQVLLNFICGKAIQSQVHSPQNILSIVSMRFNIES